MVDFLGRSMFQDPPNVPGSGRPVGRKNENRDLKIYLELGIGLY